MRLTSRADWEFIHLRGGKSFSFSILVLLSDSFCPPLLPSHKTQSYIYLCDS